MPDQKQFSLWQLMKGIMIAAIVASALMPFVQKADKARFKPVTPVRTRMASSFNTRTTRCNLVLMTMNLTYI